MTDDCAALCALTDRVVVVAGGAGGIGAACARLLRSAGAQVVVVDQPGGVAPEGCRFEACDLSREDEVAALAARLSDRHAQITALVHACGITRDRTLARMSFAEWSEVMRVNLDSAFLLLRETLPLLRAAHGASVVLISSVNGERGKFGQANYCASKAGMIGLARTAALELARWGIRVNCIAPGFIETAMTAELPRAMRERALQEIPLGRAGQPDDVARGVLFLCCELSRFITGQVLRIDGGQLMA